MKFKCNKENCTYKKELEELQEELALVRFELEELRSKRYKGKKKPSDDDKPKRKPKKKGGLFGHKGWFRKSLDELGYVSGEILVTKQGEWTVRK